MIAAAAAPTVRERPILFSAPMIRAILDGRKTQTRRVITTREPLQFIGGRGEEADPDKWGWFFDGPDHHGYMVLGRGHDERHDNGITSIRCPYGEPGDRLWCKETWQVLRLATQPGTGVVYDAVPSPKIPKSAPSGTDWELDYLADGENPDPACTFPWRPSIFMPRWASRITLEITEVRVQRLQEIGDDDARAEGVEPYTPPHGSVSADQRVPGPGFDDCRLGDQPHRLPFADLWERINGGRAPWSSNPWVWAITFRRLP